MIGPPGACNYILEEAQNASRVVLVGKAGVGKTWLARRVCESATTERSFYISFWLSLNKDFDEVSLYEDIASQLSLVPENEESEEDDSDVENSDDEEEQIYQYLTRLKDQIQQKLDKKKLKGEGKKYALLVLDDEGSVTTEKEVMEDLYLEAFLAPYGPLKILLTRRKEDKDATNDGEVQSYIKVESYLIDKLEKSRTFTLTDDYIEGLLNLLVKDGSRALLSSLERSWQRDQIVKMSMRLPAAFVVLMKSLNCFAQKEDGFMSVVSSSLQTNEFSDYADRVTSGRNPIMHLAYELLKKNDTVKNCIVLCFWHSLSFFEHCGSVNYQELIAHWILEGYFDPVRSVTKAYADGHAILMELINRGFLKIQEDNVVMPEVAMKNVTDPGLDHGLLERSRLRLSRIYRGNQRGGRLGKINQVDDMIEGVCGTRNREKITTILVSGNPLRREAPEKFVEKMKDLEVLGLFELTLTSLVPALSKLVKLHVLVIRNCNLLKDIGELKALREIYVLEVSGASSLTDISDDFFTAMPKLQSLHLSGLQIRSSPSSISKLKGLHCLIIRDCPVLEDLPDMQELVNLEVVDVSGGCRLQTCFNKAKGETKNKSKNRNFYLLRRLQLLNFSESQIERLPMFQDSELSSKLHSLTRLLLRNCSKLIKLPSLKPLSGLQTLDLSGNTGLVKIMEECFEDKKELRVLNLSGTNLCELPSTIEDLTNLSELLVRDCTKLKVLLNIQKLTSLEVFDVSGCSRLHTIKGSCRYMYYLREINLSRTRILILPNFVPIESNLRCRKVLIRSDGWRFDQTKWSYIDQDIKNSTPKDVIEHHEAYKDSDEVGDIIQIEPLAGDCAQKGDFNKERLLQVPSDEDLYKKTLSVFDSASQREVMEINETNDLVEEVLEDTEFVSFVDSSSTRLTSIFNGTRSVKGCWLKMCKDIEYLFSGTGEEHLRSLEILSVTNLPLLHSICSSGFKNLKKLNMDCCPNIKTLFPDASQLPSSLEVLHVMFCENLEKVFKEGEVPTLTTLCLHELPALSAVGAKLPNLETFRVKNCPKLEKLFDEEGQVSTLTILCLDELPMLSAVGAKLQNLKTFKVRNCPKLEKVFDEEGEVSTLTTLCIHELPLLSVVGAKLPNLETFKIKNCPKFEKVFEEESQVSTLTNLSLYELPVLSTVGAKLPNLKTFKVKNCLKLEKVFEGEGEVSTLTTLCLLDLPALTTVGANLPNLKIARVKNCPKLTNPPKPKI